MNIDDIFERHRREVFEKIANAPLTITDHDIKAMGYFSPSDRWAAESARLNAQRAAEKALRDRETERVERIRRETSEREQVTAALLPKNTIFRNADLLRFNNHAIELALRHRVRVVRSMDPEKACAYSESRSVTVPAVTNEQTYATFLHEMGHILSPEGDSSQYRYIINGTSMVGPHGEVGAWKWAASTALKFTVAMYERMCSALHSYSVSATQDERLAVCECIKWANGKVVDRPDGPDALHKKLFALYETKGL